MVSEALRTGAARLRRAGVRSPTADARLLLRFVLGWTGAELVAGLGDPVAPAARRRFDRLIAARERRRPVQHLTGRVEFYGIALEAGPEALVPRPDTETLVEAALDHLRRQSGTVRVADVGCGSGCVAIALAANLPRSRVFAVDIAPAALALAARNVRRAGLAHRVRPVRADLLRGFAAGALDAVVANLPYVPDGDIEALEPEVRDHEPRLALAGGPDGLAPLRRLAPMARRVLAPGGELAVEIGAGQLESARRAVRAAGFDHMAAISDLAGIPRVLRMNRRFHPGRRPPLYSPTPPPAASDPQESATTWPTNTP